MANLQPLETRARRIDSKQYYIATLSQPDGNNRQGLTFRAFVPETFNLSVQNHWEPIFGEQNAGGTAGGKLAAGVGALPNFKYLSRQIWLGTEPLDFNLTFLLDAYADTRADVQKPIENLLRMSTPIRDGIVLRSPGPTLISDENRIYLRIGKFFVLDSVIIKSVDITFFTIADRTNGCYMSADLNVHLSTSYTPDQNDILNYFAKGASGDDKLDANNTVPETIAAVGKEVADRIKTTNQEVDAIKNTVNDFRNFLGGGGS